MLSRVKKDKMASRGTPGCANQAEKNSNINSI